ncbi:ATP-binding protein [Streptomyces endophyticus]|uniref:NB-ARC domain-containing protein n=1 Tax=Streptomyces endophyticus TaxID=714166 RepID=A0ABU6F7W3_9ACTN|nr:NB-ARC domain-containing protein [Streptomyces endophyticus]MEB8340117.1 NB-ARC domain-containing protein [Streptomyces endophyticus]
MGSSRQEWTAGNLPPETTGFVGRESELSALTDLVTGDRLVTLTGVGGVGKTRLAKRVGAGVRAHFPDGVWLVELSPLKGAASIALAVYEALRLSDQSTRPAVEVVTDWLADKRLLLILDCCEHLTAGCAEIARTVRAAAPGVHVLATSRTRLQAPAERAVPVAPLPVTVAARRDPAFADAAVLFAQRAAEALPPVALAEEDGAAVAEICVRLEGIPLAIELAAARLTEMSLDELCRRLRTRFELLTRQADGTYGRHDREDARHQALRTTIGWSHELCTPLERLAWARLSVFADGFEQDAAARVCAGGPIGDSQVPGLLSGLVDKSIVQRTDTPCGLRYAMLDTLREYGEQWLQGLGEEQCTRRRHQDHYLRLARRGCDEWAGPDQVLWCERARAEHANMRAAMDFCLITRGDGTCLEMAGCLGFLWRHCGFSRDGERYLDVVLDLDPEPSPARTWALFARSSIAFARGDLRAAVHWGTACTTAASQPGQRDSGAAAGAAAVLGMGLAMRGELTRAAEVLDGAPYQRVREARYEITPLQIRLSRLYTHLHMSEFDRARTVSDALRADCRRYGERWVCSYADYLQAMLDLAQGDAESATRHARAALEGHHALHNTTGIAVVLDALASAVVAGGDAGQAAWLLGFGGHAWQIVGSTQMDSPGLVAVRQACERRVQQAVGDAAYETAFRKGLETTLDDGLDTILHTVRWG